jgi:2-dehydropantoate 2-reductase
MNICVIGAGAIGGWIAARLANSGAQVSVLARGATLAAIRENGLQLNEGGAEIRARVAVSDDARALATPDVLVLATKTTALASIIPAAQILMGKNTTVVSAMNGVPWWFFARADRPLHGAQIAATDRDGSIQKAISAPRVIGCVVHASASVNAPGVIQHRMGNKLIFGEAVGGASQRLTEVSALFTKAGYEVEVSEDIQRDLWYKLWGNMTMNPISAITGVTMDKLLDDEYIRAWCSAIMSEANAVGGQLGVPIAQSAEDRHAITRKLGAVRTSMLQDVQAGRAIELDALLAAVVEIGAKLNFPMPNAQALLGLTRVMARERELYA